MYGTRKSAARRNQFIAAFDALEARRLFAGTGEIAGVVFNDADINPIITLPSGAANPLAYLPNGVFDNTDSGESGAVVSLYLNGNPTPVASQTTVNGGQYDFTSLAAGSYYITVTAPTGFLLTVPAQEQIALAPTGYTTTSLTDDATRQSVVNPISGQSPLITLAANQQDLHENAGVYLPRVYVTPATALSNAGSESFPTQVHIFPGQTLPSSVIISYSTADQSAIAGTDYESTLGTVEINPGATAPGVEPTVDLINPGAPAADKIFQLDLTSNDADVVDPTVNGTIVSSTPDPLAVNASGADVTQTPAGMMAYFTLQLAEPVDAPVTVNYTLGAVGDTAVGATPAEIEAGTVKLGSVDYLAPALTSSITFPIGAVTETIPVLVLDNFGTGTGFDIVNSIDKTFTLTITSATDAPSLTPLSVVTPTTVGHIAGDTVENLNIGGTGATYKDNSGHMVSITLNGPGSAAVQRRGAATADGIRIVLTGTTSASQLDINSTGQTTINEIDDDSPLGAINASKVNLTGSMSLSGGLSKLNLNSITPANLITVPGLTIAPGVQITIGGGPLGSVVTLKGKVGRVTDTTIDSGIPIASLKAASINNQSGEASQISAPAIGHLDVAGNFQENILTNSIASFSVGGSLQDSTIRAAVSIGPVTAASLVNSQIFAGVASTIATLPTSGADLAAGSSIKSVKLRGTNAIFSNSSIAAGTVGPLQLGTIEPTTSVYSGVAALELLGVRGEASTPFSIPRQSAGLGIVFSDDDFVIEVLGTQDAVD